MKKLLYKKEQECNELRKKYMDDLREPFTLGYALQLGFSNIYLRLPDGDQVEIGYLDRVGDHLEYCGNCTDFQLSMVCDVNYFYRDTGDFYAESYTVLVAKLHSDVDAKFFDELGQDR